MRSPEPITIDIVDSLYFSATAPCGKSWPGMRHSEDVRIVLDRAMDHAGSCECPSRTTRPVPAKRLALERIRTEDDAYRVFEPHGVGTGAITYDPVIGGAGHLDVTGTLSRDFDPEREAQIIWDLMKRGRDAEEGTRAIFERLEYLYHRMAPTVTRPTDQAGGA